MVNSSLIEYIKNVRKQGFSDSQIRDTLLKHGYSKETVDESFSSLNPVSSENKEKKSPPLKIAFVLAAVCIIAALAMGYFMMNPSIMDTSMNDNQRCPNVSIAIEEFDKIPFLCALPEGKVMMILRNTGKENIAYAEISVHGEKKETEEILKGLFLVPGDTFPKQLSYDFNENGKVLDITILPGIIKDKSVYKCDSKKIPITELKVC